MKKPAGCKRVVLLGDAHCGHRAGLTPPQWRFRECSTEHVWKKFTQVQDECWKRYIGIVKQLPGVDCLVCNGDAIDGRGERSGGIELITGDRDEQCQMAADCLSVWNAKQVVMTEGTDYHVGDKESFEQQIAKMLRANKTPVKIGAHEWISVNGFVFDVKHHIGSSSIPHGRLTAVSRDEVWNAIWHEAGLQPRADMVVRSHIHYCTGGFRYVGGKKREFMTLPALQAMGTRFGARRCSGLVDWGVIAFDIDKKGMICQRHEFVTTIQATVAKAHRV